MGSAPEPNRSFCVRRNAARPGVVIIPPVALDPGADVLHSVIGPHASIGAGARVYRSVVKNSIVNEGAVVED